MISLTVEEAAMKPTCILIVAQPLASEALNLMIARDSRFDTRACTLDEAIEQAEIFTPQVIVINLFRSRMADILEICRQLTEASSNYRVLLLAPRDLSETPTLLLDAFEAGAVGVLNRDTLNSVDLIKALERVVNGAELWNMRELRQGLRQREASTDEAIQIAQAISKLTSREREVLDLLKDGLSNSEMAERLELSERTIQGYVSNILGKLSVGTRHAAVAAYYKWQLSRRDTPS